LDRARGSVRRASGFVQIDISLTTKPIEWTALFAINQALDPPRSQRVAKLRR